MLISAAYQVADLHILQMEVRQISHAVSFMSQQPQLCPTKNPKCICYVHSNRLSIKLDYSCLLLTFTHFKVQFQDVFEHPEGGKDVREGLLTLKQGRDPVVNYALSFHMLEAQINWVDNMLKCLFIHGLNTELQSQLQLLAQTRA